MVHKSKDLIAKALSYVGYLEKKSDDDLDDFTANAGAGNYTRFCRDYEAYTKTRGFQPSLWCAEYISCVVVEAFGLEAAKQLLCGKLFASCTAGRDQFKKCGQFHTENPRPGDIIMFHNAKRTAIGHCGLVVDVTSSRVDTAEGNTSSGDDIVIDNGGAVTRKSYALNSARIAGYCRMALDGIDPTKPLYANNNVAAFQLWLNGTYGFDLAVDGSYGKLTRQAAIKALQLCLNAEHGASLAVDGCFGPKTKRAVKVVKKGVKGNLVYIAQGVLYGRGYDPKGLDGKCGNGATSAILAFQKDTFSASSDWDGSCGPKTWEALFN